jgi:hypothetical protein
MYPGARSALDELTEVSARERRNDARAMVNIRGRYMLANKRNLKGDRCEFACRIVTMSVTGMALAAPVLGAPGERVIVYSEVFGQLHGAITRLLSTGFAMSIAANEQTQERIASKLQWLSKQKESPDLPDSRRHARAVPKNPMATMLLADGSLISCLVIDFSCSGAAVSADLYPQIGTPLAVGKMVGRVVRRFDEGFAIDLRKKWFWPRSNGGWPRHRHKLLDSGARLLLWRLWQIAPTADLYPSREVRTR